MRPVLDLPFWTFEGAGHGRLFAVRRTVRIDSSFEVMTPSEARAWLRRWMLDSISLRELSNLHGALFGALSTSGWGSGDIAAVLEHDIGGAIDRGDILILGPATAGRGARPAEPDPPSHPPSRPPDRPKRPGWIEVELVGPRGQRLGSTLRLTPPAGGAMSPKFDGFVRVDGITSGVCDIEFPEIDGREWGVAPAGANSGKETGFEHHIARGECISSISRRFGFASWRTVWDDRRNAALRDARRNPNTLALGDVLFVPDPDPRVEESATERRATYRTLAVTTHLRIRFEGRRTNDYELRVDGQAKKGRVAPGGLIDEVIPASARAAELVLRPVGLPGQEDRWDIELGVLEPASELRGVQARLDNLGFSCPVDGKESEETTRAVKAYQKWRGVGDGEGTLDRATRDDLARVHDG